MELFINNGLEAAFNLALEEVMTREYPQGFLMLWRNANAVIVGRNQNTAAEINAEKVKAFKTSVIRRSTGGGAVYHDVGNLNYSFVVPKQLYDVHRQFAVIQKAVESFGLQTEISGRNDLLCNGRKFSGNAFSKGTANCLHHGTLLIKTDTGSIQRYLKVKPSKLKKHGVASVQSRVVNLSELANITSENIVPPLMQSFEAVYGGMAVQRPFANMCTPDVMAQSRALADDGFLFAKWRSFSTQLSGSFPWGEVDIEIHTDQRTNSITHVDIASDSLVPDAIALATELLQGASLSQPPLLPHTDHDSAAILNDIMDLVYGGA